MAERVARHHLAEAGIDGVVVASAATSREEVGEPIDPRAARTLRAYGYDASGHTAHQVTAAELLEADLVIAMEPIHLDRMRRIAGQDVSHAILFSELDPMMEEGEGIPDPWYGGQSGFDDVLAALERGMPELVRRIRALLEARDAAVAAELAQASGPADAAAEG